MQDEQLKASLKEINDLKAALDEHAIVAITELRAVRRRRAGIGNVLAAPQSTAKNVVI